MQYRCTCGFIYDDHIGDPNRGIEPMPFAKVPEAWTCPLCGLDKDVFAPLCGRAETNRVRLTVTEQVRGARPALLNNKKTAFPLIWNRQFFIFPFLLLGPDGTEPLYFPPRLFWSWYCLGVTPSSL